MKGEKEYTDSGIATFMRTPYIGIEEAKDYDVVVMGIPVEHGISFRSGQRLAPRSIREYLFWNATKGEVFVDLSTGDVHQCNTLRVADLGDLVIWPGDAEKTNQEIVRMTEKIRCSSFPLLLGGDHSITYAAFLGTKRALEHSLKSPLGILHFDAHLDTEGPHKTLPAVHHGNMFSRLIKEGHLDGRHLVTIGVRGYESIEWANFSKENGTRTYSVAEIRARNIQEVVAEAVDYLKQSCSAVYLTFDIDCLEPSQAPGTGTPSFGGLQIQEVLSIMPQLASLPVAAFDLVEVSPPLDPSGLTVFAACEILWHFLAFGYSRLQI